MGCRKFKTVRESVTSCMNSNKTKFLVQSLGPFKFLGTMTGQDYLHFLEYHLFDLLENVPLNIRVVMWFLHDGDPAHYSRAVRNN